MSKVVGPVLGAVALVGLLVSTWPDATLAAARAELTIEIVGLESDAGRVRIAVFDSAETWLGTAAFAEIVEIENGASRWTIPSVSEGSYGIAVFHDVNGNGKNDRNFLGIPSEPYGFSNGQRARFGPPKWAKAKFEVTAPTTRVQIRVK